MREDQELPMHDDKVTEWVGGMPHCPEHKGKGHSGQNALLLTQGTET